MFEQECIAMLLAGGQGSRLGPLTNNIAKPAISFCGNYRIIDFCLSNCANSKINIVGVLTQYKPFLLSSYIGIGSAWDFDYVGGVHILPPHLGSTEGSWYRGTADAVYQNIDFIDFFKPSFVLIISGDHIYQADYNKMIDFHRRNKAQLTISVTEVPWQEASRFGVVTLDVDQRIRDFAEKPAYPNSNLASMGVYIFDWPLLKQALMEDEEDLQSNHDFGKDIIPKLLQQKNRVYAYKFRGYWRDVGIIESYYHANFDYFSSLNYSRMTNQDRRIFSNLEDLPSQYVGSSALIENSLICNGCTVLGSVYHSILGLGVYIGKGVEVRDSIILPHSKINDHSVIRKVVTGENVEIESHSVIGATKNEPLKQEGITVIEDQTVLKEGSKIEAGENVYRVR
ncbi:glucose-1-phosphate adenylyltransferase [Desulfosporosinus sp. FKB]|uniref:glucose-1-phosphate adenylyltransferase n=1 Tax=Desulfosporosinus sp. FKB TaxID=1969835 RepID=UPI000B499E11|nr:glucose-1-phosphate adenylyltransferase [Desulfosporosinus sp. FKB]